MGRSSRPYPAGLLLVVVNFPAKYISEIFFRGYERRAVAFSFV